MHQRTARRVGPYQSRSPSRSFQQHGSCLRGRAREDDEGLPEVSTKKTGNPDEARARAEAKFRKQEHTKAESDKVWAERAAAAEAGEKQRAKLKGLRLARDAGVK